MTITNAEYHADPSISASHLHAVAISPENYFRKFVDPNRPSVEPTSAMRFGTLAHCAVLEPDELHARFAVCPPRNTKAGKERAAELEAAGIEVVSSLDWALAGKLAQAVRRHPVANELLSNGKAEQSFWWTDLDTELRCKCRPDWMCRETVIDLKTTTDASPAGFARSVAKFRYHVQQAHYMAGTFATRFVFIAVEKSYPYNIGVYELDDDALAEGQRLADRDLRRIKRCRESETWPGFSPEITSLSLPAWAYDTSTIAEDF